MNDEPIIEYLRARGRVTPPPTLIDDVRATIADAPQRRGLSTAMALRLGAVVGTAGVVLVAALVVLGDRGRDTTIPPTAAPVPSSTSVPSSAPTVAPSAESASLLDTGTVTTIAALDAEGDWGTIAVQRGMDVGGYQAVADVIVGGEGWPFTYFENDPSVFYVQVSVVYRPDRQPSASAEYGLTEWRLRLPDEGTLIHPVEDIPGTQPISTFTEVVTATTDEPSVGGWLVFPVSRDLQARVLELVYQPAGFAAPAWSVLVREPGPAPDPVPDPSAPPEPVYVNLPGQPISVIDHPGADALFAEADTCTNPVVGYAVTYPDSWYTNTAVGDTPACSWFSPVFFEVTDPEEVPTEIAMTIGAFDGGIGQIPEWPRVDRGAVRIGPYEFTRFEDFIPGDMFFWTDYERHYTYVAWLDDDYQGQKLIAGLGSAAGDYDLNRAVLDRIMASMQFDR